jgi:tetratricopeptide (TPR) repeat protein
MKLSLCTGSILLAAVSVLCAAQNPKDSQHSGQKNAPAAQPSVDPGMKPPAPAVPPAGKEAGATNKPAPPVQVNRSEAYYHFQLAHMYEEMVAMTGLSEYATKAVDEYKLAIQNDPTSEYLNASLAELYAKTGRIRDAVLEAQDIIKRDPKNLEARRLLGRIYLRWLGDPQTGAQSQEMLRKAIEQYEQIVVLAPTSVEDHLLLGRLYRLDNNVAKAQEEFRTAIKIQPNSEEAVTTLSYLFNEQGDSAGALQILESVPEPERSAKLFTALGYTYEQRKDYKKAIDAYKKAVDDDHDNLDAVRGLAQNLLNDGQVDAAMQQYKVIADADPQDAQTFMRMAEIYRRDGKFEQALEALRRAQSLVSDSVEIPYNLAVIYQAMGRYDDATQMLRDLLQKSAKANNLYTPGERNNRSIFIERLGTIYREQNKTPQAVEAFRMMLPLGDDNLTRGYQEIIETYRDAKMWKQATEAAQEAVQKAPNDRGLVLALAGQEVDSGKADQGIARVKALLKGTPDDREAYLALAQMNSRLKRWKDAEESIQKALQLATKPEDKLYAQFLAGSIYERQKKFDVAEEYFRKVIAEDPRNATALNYLGYMLADRGTRLEEALGYIRRAVQLDPQNGAYLDSLGWAYYKVGNYDQAEENLRKAVEKMDTDPTVHDHMADLYIKTGRLKQAVIHWERAMEEWRKSVPADVDQSDVAKVQKKLDDAKVKLAKQESAAR